MFRFKKGKMDKTVSIDHKANELIENVKRAINLEKNSPIRDREIEKTMNELYEHFSSYPEEKLNDLKVQLEIFKLEIMLDNEFLPLNSEPIYDSNSKIQFPDKITSQEECERALDFIVHATRKKLSENFNLETDTLEKHCIDTSFYVEELCKTLNVDFLHLGLDQNLNNGMFHHFTVVKFPIKNAENKNYIIDCTYRQFFTKSESFLKRIAVMRGPAKGCSIGAYMMMTERRKQIAEQLLTKGYIEATAENIKEYFDAIIFSGRDNNYYKSHGLDFMNPKDCIPEYSINDYMNILTQNRVIDSASIFEATREILTTSDITTSDISNIQNTSRTCTERSALDDDTQL